MNLVNELDRNLIYPRDVAKEGADEFSSQSGWLSCDVDSSDESPAESAYEDYYLARNYWDRQSSLAHKAILDRAYNFIYDEAFSSDTTTESEFADDDYSLKNYCPRKLFVGDAEDFLATKTPIADCRSKSSNRICDKYLQMKHRRVEASKSVESRQLDPKNQRNAPEKRKNSMSLSSSRSSVEEIPKFEGRRWTRNKDNLEPIFRNTSRFRSAKNYTQSFADSSDLPSETFGSEVRKFVSKKYSRKYPNFGAIGIPRKRKLPSVNFNFKDRSNHPKIDFREANEETFEPENPLIRISRSSKLIDRPKLISKMRKIYSEQILIDELSKKNYQLLFSEVDSSSSDDSLVIDVEEILQENLRGKNSLFTVETILLEKKIGPGNSFSSFHRSEREKHPSFSHGSTTATSETHSNEMKLLGDIKKRIDEDFAVEKLSGVSTDWSKSSGSREESLNIIDSKASFEIISNPESSSQTDSPVEKLSPKISSEKTKSPKLDKVSKYLVNNTEINNTMRTSSKSSSQCFVDSIDSGVSTDFSRNDSELLRKDNYLEKIEPRKDENYLAMVTSPGQAEVEEEEMLAEEVDRAVQKFTEKLIMCERRAVERGLIDEIRREKGARKRKKSFQQARHSGSSSSPKSGKTFSSPRGFSKASHTSSEEEYLENISPPSLCSTSDSDLENLVLDF